VLGFSAPGHFLAWVDGDGAPMIVDPFAGGAVLTKEDAFRRIEQVTGSRVPRSDELLRPASHRQWIARMLRNLQACFTRTTRVADVGAMLELAALLEADDDASA
jgi:regulator of sirC expression with transglutaminase-like and TPR domain